MKIVSKHLLILLLAIGLVSVEACKDENGKINIFTVQDDITFGAQVSAEFDNANSASIIDSATHVAMYKYVYDIRNEILNSGMVTHKNDFVWRIRLIKDTILNAFCTPGGYIYVYTGLMKFLESKDQLAGVMGHEMGHAEKRHSTEAMTREYGIQTLIDIVFGTNKGQLVRIAAGLTSLKYSRENETQADEFSVIALYPTDYNSAGAAGFFEKLIALGQSGGTPDFLSTHPNPANRVQAIKDKKTSLGGKPGQTFTSDYAAFKSTLP